MDKPDTSSISLALKPISPFRPVIEGWTEDQEKAFGESIRNAKAFYHKHIADEIEMHIKFIHKLELERTLNINQFKRKIKIISKNYRIICRLPKNLRRKAV